MTLRIFEASDAGGDVVALHGWLSAAEVGELERVVSAHGRPLRFDLTQLAGVDADGLRELARWRRRGVRLTGASPFVELMLERTAADEGGGASGAEG
jgi:hypothetical protein